MFQSSPNLGYGFTPAHSMPSTPTMLPHMSSAPPFAMPPPSPFVGANARFAALGQPSSPLSREPSGSSGQRIRPTALPNDLYINTDAGLFCPPGYLEAQSMMSDSPGSASPSSLSRMTSQQSLASNLTTSSSTSSLRAHSSRSSLKAARHRSRSRPAHSQYIRALSLTPMLGAPGSQVRIMITVRPHATGQIRSFRCCFGRTYAETRVTSQFQNDQNEDLEDVELTVVVPPSLSTALSDLAVIVEAADANRHLVDWTPAGCFSVDTRDFQQPAIRKRSTDELGRFGAPLPLHHQLSSASLPPSFRQAAVPSADVPVSSSIDVPVAPSPWSHRSPHASADDLQHTLGITTSPGPPAGKVRGVAANTPSSSQLRHPPCEFKDPDQPFLVRTTLIPSGVVGGHSATAKVMLRFRGDLGAMAIGWTPEEWQSRRRLVQFSRSQDNHIVEAGFRAIRPIEFTEDAITISCIYREDKDECFITSVDAIYLLEALIGSHFTVEEKNRIRRNLEGFKPITVAKAKGDSDAFFRTIMAFPAPKPRNIEKDVKVFPWRILVNMLTKIIGKYSATHAEIPGITSPSAAEPIVGSVGELSLSASAEPSIDGAGAFPGGLGLAPQSFSVQSGSPWTGSHARSFSENVPRPHALSQSSSFFSSSVSRGTRSDGSLGGFAPESTTQLDTAPTFPGAPVDASRRNSHSGLLAMSEANRTSSSLPLRDPLADDLSDPSLLPDEPALFFASPFDALSPTSALTPY